MAFLIFLSAFLTFGPAIAAQTTIQFDYMGTGNGEAEIKAVCQTPKGKSEALLCEFTEVRALPLEAGDEEATLASASLDYRAQQLKQKPQVPPVSWTEFSDLPLKQRREIWAESFLAKLKRDPDPLTQLKQEECRKEPRDYYQFRGAYNETFDAFLAQTKQIGQRLCLAKDGEAFAKAMQERWDLVRSTCELHYDRYQLWMYQVAGLWTHEAKPEGESRFIRCFSKMRTEMKCEENRRCQISRGYTPEPSPKAIFHCPKDPKPVALNFSPSLPRRLPSSCKYVLDRERSSQCCAYEIRP